ncbi:hypothetical protein [Sporomusa acidovorans]|uniref:hypothetical protein n=1 Tax=Sporomusa acidovorans TaxID=112900 RepID=UPI0035A14EC5
MEKNSLYFQKFLLVFNYPKKILLTYFVEACSKELRPFTITGISSKEAQNNTKNDNSF